MTDLIARLNEFDEIRRRARIAAGLEAQQQFWKRLDQARYSAVRPNQALIQDRAYREILREARRIAL